MLYPLLGNHRPWHPHYFCALAFVPALIVQLLFIRMAHSERTAGVCICGISLFSYFIRTHVDFSVLTNVGLLFFWGVRVCIRGVPIGSGKLGFMHPTAFDAAFSKTIWTWILSAPTVFAVTFDAHELPRGLPVIGGSICVVAIAVDAIEKNPSRGKFTRNPYVFASLCVCWGLYLIHPSVWTLIFPIIFTHMVVYSHGGYKWSEAMRKNNEDDTEYTLTTSPLIPLPVGAYVTVPKEIKKYIFCDLEQ